MAVGWLKDYPEKRASEAILRDGAVAEYFFTKTHKTLVNKGQTMLWSQHEYGCCDTA
jgi:hypothetical protein